MRLHKILNSVVSVIGGSHISKVNTAAAVEQPKSLGGDSQWLVLLFVVAASMLFGGAAGTWFSTDPSITHWFVRGLQLAIGSMVMGAAVSVLGSVFFGKDPIRWGMGMPVVIYFGGILMALMSGHGDAMALLYGAPILLGLTITAGVLGAYLVDGGSESEENA